MKQFNNTLYFPSESSGRIPIVSLDKKNTKLVKRIYPNMREHKLCCISWSLVYYNKYSIHFNKPGNIPKQDSECRKDSFPFGLLTGKQIIVVQCTNSRPSFPLFEPIKAPLLLCCYISWAMVLCSSLQQRHHVYIITYAVVS